MAVYSEHFLIWEYPGRIEVSKLQEEAAVEALKSSAEVVGVAVGGTMGTCTSCKVNVLKPQHPCY